MEESWLNLLRDSVNPDRIQVNQVWPNRNVWWIEHRANLLTALQLLKEKNILSLPVINLDTNQCVGVIDVLDIALFVVASFPSPESITLEHLTYLGWEGKQFLVLTPVSQIIAFSKSYSYQTLSPLPIYVTSPLRDLITLFGSGIHRVPILNEKSDILNFVSQSDILRFIAENSFALGKKKDNTVQELNLSQDVVHFVRKDLMSVFALSHMISRKVSAVPIVDARGTLVGNFSASDLRGLSTTDFTHLLLPIYDFVFKMNPKALFPLTCKKSDTLEHVIFKMVGAKVHRLWCIGDERQLLGVVTMTDIFQNYFTSPMEF